MDFFVRLALFSIFFNILTLLSRVHYTITREETLHLNCPECGYEKIKVTIESGYRYFLFNWLATLPAGKRAHVICLQCGWEKEPDKRFKHESIRNAVVPIRQTAKTKWVIPYFGISFFLLLMAFDFGSHALRVSGAKEYLSDPKPHHLLLVYKKESFEGDEGTLFWGHEYAFTYVEAVKGSHLTLHFSDSYESDIAALISVGKYKDALQPVLERGLFYTEPVTRDIDWIKRHWEVIGVFEMNAPDKNDAQ